MRKIAALILFAVILIPCCALAEPYAVTSAALTDQAKELDLREVTFDGEIIGDIMIRGDYTWINVSDGENAIGVYVKTAGLGGVSIPGRYGMHGDEVRVIGVFHRACPMHGGDMDIHAEQVKLIAAGHPVTHETAAWKVIAVVLLILMDTGLVAYILRKRRRY